jgi:MraZ protein
MIVVESGVIIMLMGEFHHNLDEKGRIIIPSKLREELGENIIVTRGLEDCLFIYSEKEWSKVVSKLKELPFTKKDARSFTRMFLSGATSADFDKQGRIKIAPPLLEYASLKKECIVIGVNDRLEIWSKEKWDSFMNDATENLSDLADHLFETNFEG